MDELSAVAQRWKLALVEDAAESLGSRYKGKHTGQHGLVSALSFNGNKVVTTGGGGAILTNDPELARRAKHLTTTARVLDRWNFIHDEVGYNYRMPNINAALGCAQIERLDDFVSRKRRLADKYRIGFAQVSGVRFLSEPDGTASNYWLNAIVLENGSSEDMVAVLACLNDAGYSARPIWTLMNRLPMFVSNPRADLSVSERMADSVINLPSSPGLADA
ncbi:DegT/DnrJ/EryC1/StrS family aminotransferase [Sphingomonas lacunae]|uniref:DegT/DnrJ/EryC1/StrS family aminotransferase n=1 Tax=Sphingomonas lacunae TaxID=2698828 RepID=UPI0024840093|nr:DegT/DnrJ/EryC1/StrS family aminotransferase [Sphingomonas lacunae]